MLTNNFKKLLYFGNNGNFINVLGNSVAMSSVITSTTSGSVTNNHEYLGCGRTFNYSTTTGSNNYTNEQTTYTWVGVVSTANNATISGFTLFVGSGTTAPTVSDYKLETPVELAVTAASCYQNEDGKVIVSRTFYNSTSSSVTLNELGLYSFYNNANPTQSIILLGRKVFSAPVTIASGDSYTFTYTVDMSDITLNPET